MGQTHQKAVMKKKKYHICSTVHVKSAFFFHTGMPWCICSFVMWSGVNINISFLALSPQRAEGAQTSARSMDGCLKSAVGVLQLFCQTQQPTYPPNPVSNTWDLKDPPPPIFLRLARVNRINLCPSRFKTETARQRITLGLPSFSRQLDRNVPTTLLPSRLWGKIKRPLHVWIFIKANETMQTCWVISPGFTAERWK